MTIYFIWWPYKRRQTLVRNWCCRALWSTLNRSHKHWLSVNTTSIALTWIRLKRLYRLYKYWRKIQYVIDTLVESCQCSFGYKKLLQCNQAGHLDRNCGKKARPKENESKRISRPSNGNKWAFAASSCDDLNDDDWILVTVYKLSFGPWCVYYDQYRKLFNRWSKSTAIWHPIACYFQWKSFLAHLLWRQHYDQLSFLYYPPHLTKNWFLTGV